MNDKIVEYIKELTYRCNTINKGFVYLLNDKEMMFNTYNEYLSDYEKTDSNKELLKTFKSDDIALSQQNYFFRHLNFFFNINEKNSIKDKYACILSSICAYLDNPINYIVSVLNRNYQKPQNYTSVLKSQKFIYLYSNQLNSLKKTNYNLLNNIKIERSIFSSENIHIYSQLSYYFNNINVNQVTFASIVSDICDIYIKELENKSKLPNLSIVGDSIIVSTQNSEKKKEEIEKMASGYSVTKKITFNENNSAILNALFNPENSYISSTYDKYKEMCEKLKYDSKDCRTIKTVIYVLTYIMKDKDFNAAKYMTNILNSDIGWAVGDENNKEPSFYGESDIAKFFYGYYSYMTGKENPYTDLINNKIVKDMDYNAMLINKYFKENGLANFGFADDKIKQVYNILVNFKELVKLFDSPITLTGGIDNFIKGIISSIMNAAATTVDFSISAIVKELFYAEIIPINKKRYSLSQIYNYVNFIKLILEQTADYKEVSYIDREEFINQAYALLGIKKDSLAKIGYLAYDLELNENASLIMYDDRLFQNQNEGVFTLRNDMKLLYSLIQFGIQKKSVLTGDPYYESKFIFGNEYSVKEILEYLTETEIYYVFTLYGINIWTLDDKLGALTNEDILNFNKELLTIDYIYDHHANNFYNVYLDKSPNRVYEEMEAYDFTNTKYKNLVDGMYNYYRKAIKYNKQQLDIIVFESNDISEIDDFFVRFLPSTIELMKTLGQNSDSIQSIAKFLDALLSFITDVLFKNLFIEVKISINRLLKRYTDSMFEKLDSFSSGSTEISLDLSLSESKLMQSIDLILKMIETGNFNLFSIQTCFNGNISYNEGGYDAMEEDSLVYNHGHNSISRNDFVDDTDDSIDKSYDGANTDKSVKIEVEEIYKSNDDKIKETIINHSTQENKKIYYENGDIIIEKKDGTKEIVVSKNDKNDINISYIEFPEIAEKNLSENEYDQLIEIRDYIRNITNKKLQYLNKKLSLAKNELNIELNKAKPSYNNIKSINKTIQDLTEQINDVKKENRILETTNDVSTVVIKDFNENTSESSESIYNTLDNFFKNKKEILKEVNEVAIDNDVTLTNYQITQLLK